MTLSLIGRHPRLSHFFDKEDIAIGNLKEQSDSSPVVLAGYKIEEVVSPVLQGSHAKFLVAQAKYQKGLETAKAVDAKTAEFYKKNFSIKERFPFKSWKIFEWLFGMKFVDKATLTEKTHLARKLWVIEVSSSEKKRLEKVKKEIESEYKVVLQTLDKHPDIAIAKEQLEKVYKTLFDKTLT